MKNAYVMLNAERMEAGPVRAFGGGVQQEIRLLVGSECVCVILLTYPPDSPTWHAFHAGRTLDGMPAVRVDSIQSDAEPGAAP